MAGYGSTSSSSSVIMGVGSKFFVVSEVGDYKVGNRVRVTYNSFNFMDGQITGITDNNIIVFVDQIIGSGIYSRWVFS
jgi:glutamine cyclotransferase